MSRVTLRNRVVAEGQQYSSFRCAELNHDLSAIHVIPAIAELASGPSYSVVRLCDSVRQAGANVQLAAMDWAPLISPPRFLKTFPVGIGPRTLGRSPQMKKWLYQQLSSGKVHVIHNHGMWQMNSIYPANAARKHRVSFICSPRGALSQWAMSNGSKLKRIFWPLLQRPALRQANCFHATSESEYNDIRRLGFRQPVAVIPNGIDIPTLTQHAAAQTRTLLFLGRIHPVKGLDLLLPAWKAVQNRFPDWQLVIAGSDEGYHGTSGYLTNVITEATKLGLSRVHFVGEIQGEQKRDAFQRVELFVLPSYSENFGISVAEALAAGTPAVTTTGAPWSELENRRAGWQIGIGIQPLVDCLALALAKPQQELAEMGIAGREWMIREYRWKELGDLMLQTYEWMVHNTGSPPACVRLD